MSGKEFFKLLTGLDDKYINEAKEVKSYFKKKKLGKRLIYLAASFLFIFSAISLRNYLDREIAEERKKGPGNQIELGLEEETREKDRKQIGREEREDKNMAQETEPADYSKLEKLHLEKPQAGSGGLSGFYLRDIGEANLNGDSIGAAYPDLPVFKSQVLAREDGCIKDPDFETMRSYAYDLASILGLDANSLEESISQAEEGYLDRENLPIQAININSLSLEGQGVRIQISPDLSASLEMDGIEFGEDMETIGQSFIGKYGRDLGYEFYEIERIVESYDFSGSPFYKWFIRAKAGDKMTSLVLEGLQNISYSDIGGGRIMFNLESMRGKAYIGKYPLISLEEAKIKLEEGKYFSTAFEKPDISEIKGVEISYSSKPSLYYIPYYDFYIKTGEEAGLLKFDIYSVPAISDEFLIIEDYDRSGPVQ